MKDKIIVVGDVVYCPNWNKVDEGKIIRIERCKLNSQGLVHSIGDPTGDHVLYTAKFASYYKTQTYEWEFFTDKAKAYKKLAESIESVIHKLHFDIKNWETIKADALVKSKE